MVNLTRWTGTTCCEPLPGVPRGDVLRECAHQRERADAVAHKDKWVGRLGEGALESITPQRVGRERGRRHGRDPDSEVMEGLEARRQPPGVRQRARARTPENRTMAASLPRALGRALLKILAETRHTPPSVPVH